LWLATAARHVRPLIGSSTSLCARHSGLRQCL